MRIAGEPPSSESLFLVTYRGFAPAEDVPVDFRIALESIATSCRRLSTTVWLLRCRGMRSTTLYDTLRMYGDVRDALVVARVEAADVEGPLSPEVRRWLRAGDSSAPPVPPAAHFLKGA